MPAIPVPSCQNLYWGSLPARLVAFQCLNHDRRPYISKSSFCWRSLVWVRWFGSCEQSRKILKGISATTYPTAVEELRGFGIEVETAKHLVTHGNIGTAAGCLAAVDLMGWAIEKMYDPKVRQDVIASVLPVGQGQACIY